ncbi:hypothetical protein [Candidatus Accumulibacter cognatus]|uniref:Uncharacterized protein n=1 Tax=Candidatus Accumulibacter cognatus TaxID=2954383 RepID=A0A080M5U4_9PROT|nr:hypothetical protein [Candidatus Accumulibacter cognatus]KFB75870.1 MAG: hypothetical protein AW06_003037 [Candidatus Accumulibacter cognatus]
MIRTDAVDVAVLESLVGQEVAAGEDLDELGYNLALAHGDAQGAGLESLWESAKSEFRTLLCTTDARYADLRRRISQITDNYTTTLVAAITGAVAATLSVTTALLTPLVSLLVITLLRVGKEAICNLKWGT